MEDSRYSNVTREQVVATIGVLWTVEEVANFLRLKPATVRAKARRGELPGVKLIRPHDRRTGGRWLFERASILDLIQRGSMPPEERVPNSAPQP